MPESERLVEPFYVQYNSTATEEDDTNLAFPFMVVHVNDNEHYDGWVYCADERNSAGLSVGLNWRANVGRGGPGQRGSWSEIPLPEVAIS